MEHKTAKGNKFTYTPQKNQRKLIHGFRKVLADWGKNKRFSKIHNCVFKHKINPEKKKILMSLAIDGTLDILAKKKSVFYKPAKLIEREHSVNKGYFKKVYVLSDHGRLMLEFKRLGFSVYFFIKK